MFGHTDERAGDAVEAPMAKVLGWERNRDNSGGNPVAISFLGVARG